LAKDDRNQIRYTTREMLEAEKSLLHRTQVMDQRRSHGVSESHQASALSQRPLSDEQEAAFRHVTAAGDLKAVVGVAGSGKSTLLGAAREAFEAEGYTVKGAALSGIAAENLEVASGIGSRTLASYEYAWKDGRDALTPKDVLVIDEAGMIGTKQLERVLAAADHARAKVILVGDPEQLQAIEAGAAFRGVLGQSGMVELTQVRRQNEAWAREATQALAGGRTADAVQAYADRGALVASATNEEARAKLLAAWATDRRERPADSQLILAYTRDDVRALNRAARELLQAEGKLGAAETIVTTRGAREMAAGERVMILKNDKTLGVKNGSIGTLERIQDGVLQVRLDGADERRVAVDTRQYQDLDDGYASTIHKSQGATVDRSYVLASRYFDRHTSYVALSRHRAAAAVFYAEEEFGRAGQGGAVDGAQARRALEYTLARARPKELAHDYLDLAQPLERREAALEAQAEVRTSSAQEGALSVEALQARGREAWAALRAQSLKAGMSAEEIQRAARERWQAYREGQAIEPPAKDRGQDRSHGQDDDQSL
jgi:Ti-type conjugative transfer relaxase TraA